MLRSSQTVRIFVFGSTLAVTMNLACIAGPDNPLNDTDGSPAMDGDALTTSSGASIGSTSVDPEDSSTTSIETSSDATTDTTTGDDVDTGESSTDETANATTDDPDPGPECGPGILEDGEECDEGDDNHIHGTCIPEICTIAICGDGHVLMDAEDPENSEECDLGPENGPAASCDAECNFAALAVFVSSIDVGGNLRDHDPLKQSGVVGADKVCQGLAETAGVPRHEMFLAWLSDEETSPALRFTIPAEARGFALLDGTELADDWADLIDGTLKDPINLTDLYYKSLHVELSDEEANKIVALDKLVWSNTHPDGTSIGYGQSCDNWKSNADADMGRLGSTSEMNAAWTQDSSFFCSTQIRLYCFEQPLAPDDGG